MVASHNFTIRKVKLLALGPQPARLPKLVRPRLAQRRRPPGRPGSWKEYRPSMFMWWRTNGERRATSASRNQGVEDQAERADLIFK